MTRKRKDAWSPTTPWFDDGKQTKEYWPPYVCKNPSCKSQGKSHPNCHCSAPSIAQQYKSLEYAQGGEVKLIHFCEACQPHDETCEYYAEGGAVEQSPTHKLGAQALDAALQNGLFKGHHEVSDAILRHKEAGPLIAAVAAHGGAPSLLKMGSNSVFDDRVGMKPRLMTERAQQLASGFHGGEEEDHPWRRKGADLKTKLPEMMADPKESDLSDMAEGLAGRDIHSSAKPFISPVALKLVAQEATPDEMEQGISYAEHIGKGMQKINRGVDSIFDKEQKGLEPIDARSREKLHKFIAQGKFQDQMQSETTPDPDSADEPPVTEGTASLAKHFPEQNLMLQAARTRVVGYLNSVRPQDAPTLPFDQPFVSKMQQRSYNAALDIANDPLSVLQKVKSGMITPTDVRSLQAMYPELYQHLNQKLTEKISQAQIDKKLVPPATRRALAVFLGAPLDTTMTPQSIQTIQAMYAKQRQAAQTQQAPKKSTTKLDKASQEAQTNSQALAARQQRPR